MRRWEVERKTVPVNEEHWLLHHNKSYVMYSSSSRAVSAENERFGKASVNHLYSSPFVKIRDTVFIFNDSISGGASFDIPRIVLYLCLEGQFVLEENDRQVDTANFLAFRTEQLRNVKFQSSVSNRIITIEIYPDKVAGFGSSMQEMVLAKFPAKEFFFTHKLSPALKSSLYQMIQCPYPAPLKELYMEGKLLEFLAVYLNEAFYQQEILPNGSIKLSRQDISSIRQAKQILDQNFILPPTLADLSKLICLNEFKLKNGFKHIYSQTVHSYVVDRRLEFARQLLDERKLNVGEVASYIGYSNPSYFALAFRKKNGVSPSEYLLQS